MNLFKAARAGFQSVSARPGSGYGWGRASAGGGSTKDWTSTVGLAYDVAPIYSAINFACSSFSEVEIIHERPDGKGGFARVVRSPIEALLQAPNPWYTWDTYLSGCLVSEMAGQRGVSFTYKHRSTAKKLVGLEYLPHYGVIPYTAPGSGNFVDYYRLSIGSGAYKTVDPSEILLQRFGFMSPLRPQESFGPINALTMGIVNERQALAFSANMLSNVGAGRLIIPGKAPDGTQIVFGEAQQQQIKQVVNELREEGVGGFAMVPVGVNVSDLQFSPADLQFDAILGIAEEQVACVFLIAPASLYFGTGLRNQNNRASAEAAAKASARSFTKPYMEKKAAQFTMDLVPELGEPGDRLRFKTEDIEALQEDKTETEKSKELKGNYWTINELRAADNPPKPPIPGGDITLSMLKAKQPDPANPDEGDSTAEEDSESDPQDVMPAKKRAAKK